MCTFIFFFFSSRRRHTRLQGDWSSDVCSSDLAFAVVKFAGAAYLIVLGILTLRRAGKPAASGQAAPQPASGVALVLHAAVARSEERRVGKECRSRGSTYEEKEQ